MFVHLLYAGFSLGQGLKDFKKASRVDDEPDNTKAESGEDDKKS